MTNINQIIFDVFENIGFSSSPMGGVAPIGATYPIQQESYPPYIGVRPRMAPTLRVSSGFKNMRITRDKITKTPMYGNKQHMPLKPANF